MTALSLDSASPSRDAVPRPSGSASADDQGSRRGSNIAPAALRRPVGRLSRRLLFRALFALILIVAALFPLPRLIGAPVLFRSGFVTTLPAAASAQFPLQAVSRQDIGPGIVHETFVVTGESPQAIHVVRVERDNPFVTLTASLGRDQVEGTESVLNQARRVHKPGQSVVAGVNADFFASAPIAGQPVGIHMERGELVVSPNGRPVFGIDKDGNPVIRMAELRGEVWREGSFEDELFARAPIDEVNRPLTRLEMVLYTPRLGADTPPVNGTLVTLRGIGGPLTPGATHTGVVVATDAIRSGNGMRARIPDDGVVLAARGPTQVLLDELTPGEWVHFRVELADPLQDVANAVAGWPILLQDGAKTELNGADPLVAGRHPRTAVGYNDAELLLVTVDGRQPGYANGMNLHELADLMAALGATDALNLDGGGSTTMLVRPPGRFEPAVVNRPSDGHERTVANALFVLSSAPAGTLTRLIPVPAHDTAVHPISEHGLGDTTVRVLLGSRLPLSVLGQDARHGPVPVDPERVLWSATGAGDVLFNAEGDIVFGSAGDVVFGSGEGISASGPAGPPTDGLRPGSTPGATGEGAAPPVAPEGSANPHFVAAERPGTAVIRARSGLASGTLEVEVVEAPAIIYLRSDVVNVAAGETIALVPSGLDERGRPVWLNPEQLEWSVGADGIGVASISSTGVVTGLSAGEAFVQGRIGTATATARIVVDKPPVPLPSFHSPDSWFANAARARASITSAAPPEPIPAPIGAGASNSGAGASNSGAGPRDGDVSGTATVASSGTDSVLKLQYDFTGAEGATAAAYVQAVEPVPLPDRPGAIGVWVYADNNEHWLRANVFDGEGTRHVVDFTPVGGITWKGWRWVTAPLPQDIPLPVAFERIYVAEIHRHRQTPGILYFDRLQALYTTPQPGCDPDGAPNAGC